MQRRLFVCTNAAWLIAHPESFVLIEYRGRALPSKFSTRFDFRNRCPALLAPLSRIPVKRYGKAFLEKLSECLSRQYF
jgi:hypothetical protein